MAFPGEVSYVLIVRVAAAVERRETMPHTKVLNHSFMCIALGDTMNGTF
jgi:hypothetical protein